MVDEENCHRFSGGSHGGRSRAALEPRTNQRGRPAPALWVSDPQGWRRARYHHCSSFLSSSRHTCPLEHICTPVLRLSLRCCCLPLGFEPFAAARLLRNCCIVFFLRRLSIPRWGRTTGETSTITQLVSAGKYHRRLQHLSSLSKSLLSSELRVPRLVRALSHAFSGTFRLRIERPFDVARCA